MDDCLCSFTQYIFPPQIVLFSLIHLKKAKVFTFLGKLCVEIEFQGMFCVFVIQLCFTFKVHVCRCVGV